VIEKHCRNKQTCSLQMYNIQERSHEMFMGDDTSIQDKRRRIIKHGKIKCINCVVIGATTTTNIIIITAFTTIIIITIIIITNTSSSTTSTLATVTTTTTLLKRWMIKWRKMIWTEKVTWMLEIK